MGIKMPLASDLIGPDGKFTQAAIRYFEEIERIGNLSEQIIAAFGTTRGDLLMHGADGIAKLQPGTSGHFLKSNGALADLSYADPPVWELIEARTVDGDEAFTGLAGYQEILVIGKGITSSGAGVRRIRVSTDNGVSYLDSSGDYIQISSGGVETALDGLPMYSGGSASARTFALRIPAFNVASTVKLASNIAVGNQYLINTTSALNALQLTDGAGTPSGGTAYLLGIPAS
jgi:hypothetical protein